MDKLELQVRASVDVSKGDWGNYRQDMSRLTDEIMVGTSLFAVIYHLESYLQDKGFRHFSGFCGPSIYTIPVEMIYHGTCLKYLTCKINICITGWITHWSSALKHIDGVTDKQYWINLLRECCIQLNILCKIVAYLEIITKPIWIM